MLKFKNFTTVILFLMILSTFSFAQKEDYVKFGGAVRYNIISTSYESESTPTSNSFTWDTWRLNVDARTAGVDLSFEYRFYPTFGTHFIHHGFLGYAFSEDVYMELGVTQVPFGIETYASHSWWFQIPYYVGLEDDYDMGINFDITSVENLKLSIAYFRQAEPEGPQYGGDVTFGNAGPGRYSYDIVTTGNASIRELNQFNLRAAYNVNENIEIGASAQFGEIYNSVVDESKTATAFAGHVVANYNGFNFKGEYIAYDYQAVDNNGNEMDVVQMGAYGYEYFGGADYTGGVAAKANIIVAGLAYSIPVEWGPISNIQPYVDYSVVQKDNDNFYDTQHLVPGILVTAGSIYTYVDLAMGKNQPWLTDNFGKGLGSGVEDPDWNTRFNINIGYYF